MNHPLPFHSDPTSARRRGRVLVVDDDAVVRYIFAHWMALWGLEVVIHADAHSALRDAGADGFDLAVIDYYLPDLKGLELIERLRTAAHANGLAAPHFALHSTDFDLRERARSAGVEYFIPKPLRPAELCFALEHSGCQPLGAPRLSSDTERFDRLRIELAAATGGPR